MIAPSYSTACPICGGSLQPVALSPATAPWLCNVCHRAFFASELTQVARDSVHAPTWTWKQRDVHIDVASKRNDELGEAVLRGVSLRHDQLHIAHPALLSSTLTRRGVDRQFVAFIEQVSADRQTQSSEAQA